ncbi:hypothetical protein [Niallia sp. FSL R7-0271]|uniref:hypothetical protein n=1 Tax=Niallia sp. FSL R7-0271 TaxID=2921678 RepID=UPI0030FBAEC7
MLLERAEMFINFSVVMYKKKRIRVAVWASKECEKYLERLEKKEAAEQRKEVTTRIYLLKFPQA